MTEAVTAPLAEAEGGASAQAIRAHYDISNDFYSLWLDPTMAYSCALWEAGDTLELRCFVFR
jgi:cyclopropane-fatty-acyl-phospholipid synthase